MAAKRTRTPTTSSSDRTAAYALAVVAGEIVAGPHVRNACRRHLKDLQDGHERGLYFDQTAAQRVFEYFETILKLSEGQFEGRSFELHPSQAFILGSLFGWKKADGNRRFRRAYIEMGKGNGKSPMAGGIGLYGMTSDGEAGAQIYAAAAKKEQAGILFADAVKMVKASKALMKRLEFSGGEGREYNIAHHKSGSFFRPVSRDTGRTGSGPRPYFVLADEVHELPDRRAIEMLERGFKFRRQPLLFMITNSGSDRNSVAWEEHEHAVKVAAGHTEAVNDPTFVGEPLDDRTFSYVCALDDGDDPLEDPTCWAKANPLLGITITEETLGDIVHQAKAIPGQLNGVLRLHFCVWTDAETAWMTRATLEPALADFEIAEHHGKPVYGGLDLSQVRDLTAAAFVVQTGSLPVTVMVEGEERVVEKPTFDAWIEAWTPGDTVDARQLKDKLPYRTWIEAGHLHAPKGKTINFRHVAQTLADYDQGYTIQLMAYDRYVFRRFEDDAKQIGLSLTFAEHPQGGTKKGKPLEAAVEAAKAAGQPVPEGMWMPGSLNLLEEALLEGRIRLKKNPVLVSALMSAVIETDKWDNRWLSKERSINKIDPAVALCMAIGAAHASFVRAASVYEKRGIRFL
ncbi:terminase large subunit [Stenotrophomonas maltophilia]|uniref:terminase large subunit n=1 Tax=Stenotrophomonas maltophilia TaxID=40324 RepID=UPI0013DB4C5D|nr:terminase large subunit [Stenotrophomonas maltophilia]